MTIWDEIRLATAAYMRENEITTRHLAEYLDCSPQKVSAFVPKFDSRGNIVNGPHDRPTMAEPALSTLVDLLRDNGYIERRMLIPASERV